jgi:CshA-type fibril repeat protein
MLGLRPRNGFRRPLLRTLAGGMGLAVGLAAFAATPASAASPPHATAVWSSGLGSTLGAHTIGISGPGNGGTATIPWATAVGTDDAVGSGVQSESAGLITMAPNSGVAGFISFSPPVTNPVFLVANGSPGELLGFGPNVELLDSNNVSFNSTTGALTFTAAATGSSNDGFAVRVNGTFGNVPFGDPGEAQLVFSFSNGSMEPGSVALTLTSPAPVVDDISTATTAGTPVTVTPAVELPAGRTLDVAQTRLIAENGDAVTTLTNADGTWEVDPGTGAITFTPAAGATGPAEPVTYRVQDSAGIQASATIAVEIVPEVGVPLASPLAIAAAVALVPTVIIIRRRRRTTA